MEKYDERIFLAGQKSRRGEQAIGDCLTGAIRRFGLKRALLKLLRDGGVYIPGLQAE